MFDRADYSLSDFMLFSARVYFRMFELHNAALWPLHILAFIFGAFLIAAAIKPTRLRIRSAYALLALAWLFIAWSFFLERYASINWAAVYVAPVFMLQAALLVYMAVRPEAPECAPLRNIRHGLATSTLVFSIIGYPLVAPVLGRSWNAAEVFAIAPDPTAIATLAILVIGRGMVTMLAAVIPLLWLIVTTLTLHTLGSPEFVLAPIAVLLCGVAVIARN